MHPSSPQEQTLWAQGDGYLLIGRQILDREHCFRDRERKEDEYPPLKNQQTNTTTTTTTTKDPETNPLTLEVKALAYTHNTPENKFWCGEIKEASPHKRILLRLYIMSWWIQKDADVWTTLQTDWVFISQLSITVTKCLRQQLIQKKCLL